MSTMAIPAAGRLVRRSSAQTVRRPAVQALDEEAIVRRCQEGDHGAFRVLVERWLAPGNFDDDGIQINGLAAAA